MRSFACLAAVLCLLGAAARAHAVGEIITDIRVQNNNRTDEGTVRSIAGVNIGDELQTSTLEIVRERLHTSGLFADVNVYWEPWKDGVRVNIVIREKFPWAPVPTFSKSPGYWSAGLVIGHGNLFGRGKRGLIGGRVSNVDSGGLLVYDDPALFGSWLFYQVRGKFQRVEIPEYGNVEGLPQMPIRTTRLQGYGGEVNLGVAWFRKVRTSIGWSADRNQVRDTIVDPTLGVGVGPAAQDADRGILSGNVTFDFRAREHAVMYGNALSFSLDHATPRYGSDENIRYWKASANYEQGVRFFRRHNLVFRVGGFAGENLPLWAENSAGGSNLRGFLYRQFSGDSHLRSQAEYHFPLFSIKKLDLRALVFNDTAAIWWRKLPAELGNMYEMRTDGRQFLPPNLLVPGLDPRRDVHSSVGVGIRFYLRSVAVPLVGIDLGYGFGERTVRPLIVIGA